MIFEFSFMLSYDYASGPIFIYILSSAPYLQTFFGYETFNTNIFFNQEKMLENGQSFFLCR